jgi:hypothetical protein
MDDFQIIDILNEVECKYVVKLDICFLNEFLVTVRSYLL